MTPSQYVLKKIEKQNTAMKRINNTIVTLRRFARKSSDHYKDFLIVDAVNETCLLLEDMIRSEKINFTKEIQLHNENTTVHGDMEQIIQAMINLITNAKD